MTSTITVTGLPAIAGAPSPVLRLHAGHAATVARSERWALLLIGHATDTADEIELETDRALNADALLRRWDARGCGAFDGLDGNFAIAIVDRLDGAIHLTVDRYGVRSLFYTRIADGWRICTEPGPLLAELPDRLDPEGWTDVRSLRLLAGPHTLWATVSQVAPAARVRLDPDGAITQQVGQRVALAAERRPMTVEEAARRTTTYLSAHFARLRDSGIDRVIVPLSGGIDSSIVAALAKRCFPRVDGVTVRFDAFDNPELPRAQAVADRIGIPLHVVPVSSADVARCYPAILDRLQEPPRHFNNVAVYRMLEAMRDRGATVLAGDDVIAFGFGEVGPAVRLTKRSHRVKWLPAAPKQALGALLRQSGLNPLVRTARYFEYPLADLIREHWAIRYSAAGGAALGVPHGWCLPSASALTHMPLGDGAPDDQMTRWAAYTINHMLARRNTRLADAMGMTYVHPFHDPAISRMAATWPLPLRYDLPNARSKPVLREVCAQLVGRDVAEWPKLGFPSPETAWLEGPLRERIDTALAPNSRISRVVDVDALRTLPVGAHRQAIWTALTLHDCWRADWMFPAGERVVG
jgi:asparagine synthase (glutamine-hydrolysing)